MCCVRGLKALVPSWLSEYISYVPHRAVLGSEAAFVCGSVRACVCNSLLFTNNADSLCTHSFLETPYSDVYRGHSLHNQPMTDSLSILGGNVHYTCMC